MKVNINVTMVEAVVIIGLKRAAMTVEARGMVQ
jgi:hypothetical protein